MPEAERRDVPRGQPKGEATRQRAFIAQAAAPEVVPAAEAPEAEAPAPGAEGGFSDADIIETVLSASTRRPAEPAFFGADQALEDDLADLDDWLPVFEEIARLPDAPPLVAELVARARARRGS